MSPISIHLMFLLIGLNTGNLETAYKYFNTSHVSINLSRQFWKIGNYSISIHLMFLLIIEPEI